VHAIWFPGVDIVRSGEKFARVRGYELQNTLILVLWAEQARWTDELLFKALLFRLVSRLIQERGVDKNTLRKEMFS